MKRLTGLALLAAALCGCESSNDDPRGAAEDSTPRYGSDATHEARQSLTNNVDAGTGAGAGIATPGTPMQ